ncbi:MAG: HdeD family acid-resistance protein [bacterium]|nr:HdeD family acid-resistance protein [bacterium]
MSESESATVAREHAPRLIEELAHLKQHWWWMTVLGALLAICGIFAIAYPLVSSVSVVFALGAVLLIAGIAVIISSFWTGTWSAFLVQLLIGVIYAVVGVMITETPVEATGALTLLAAAIFVVAGIFRMVAAISIRFPQWGWVLLNGAVSLLLGVLIFKQYPASALWLIGTLFGVDMLFNGITWIMLSFDIRNLKIRDLG